MAAISSSAMTSSSLLWSSNSTSSSCFLISSPATAAAVHPRDKIKLTSWKYSNRRNHGMLQLSSEIGKYGQNVQPCGKLKRTRQLILSAISDSQASLNEAILYTQESKKLEMIFEDQYSSPKYISCDYNDRTIGKPGFISFHGVRNKMRDEVVPFSERKDKSKVIWYLGPTILVAFLVLPSLYLRKVASTVLEDSLLTDFLILFFTEALFYSGVAIFLGIVDFVRRPSQNIELYKKYIRKSEHGLQISSAAAFLLSLIIPLLTMGMVWPWTGPAASATLAPYLVGLVVQFAFEKYACYKKSPAWTVIPIIFQVYRLHQLNRAAQLVQALYISVRGAETTTQTLAINNSLWTLLVVLQILGVICIWSLANFLMRFLPPQVLEP